MTSVGWTSIDDVRKKMERAWNRGDVLRSCVECGEPEQVCIRLTTPSTREIAAKFGQAQDWSARLEDAHGVRLEYRQRQGTTLGMQSVPCAVWFDRPLDIVAFLGKESTANGFVQMHAETVSRMPEITPWLEANPFRGMALSNEWERILNVLDWMKGRSPEKIYLRQVDLPGIDSKFIELHLKVFTELFGVVLGDSIDESPRQLRTFHERFGFLRESPRIRFRILDPAISFAALPAQPDVELDARSFASLELPIRRVFVTENKTNFLMFPEVEGAIVIFGSGYGWRSLEKASWLHSIPLYYWGDIDTHGFAILSELRLLFSHTQSFLMDSATLLQHRDSWTIEESQVKRSIERLTQAESELSQQLQSSFYCDGVRLEQEKVSFLYMEEALGKLPY